MAGHPDEDVKDSTSDDRPLAVRRKRRTSSVQTAPTTQTAVPQLDDQHNPHEASSKEPKTPTKPKKRVRFSDPGPDMPTCSSSTGLTPYIKGTALSPTTGLSSPSAPRLLAAKPRRRSSLPAKPQYSFSSPSMTPPTTSYLAGQVQISSLRQVLDERTKRRLRRSHMSEEINKIDEEKKSKHQWTQQIQELKTELALAKQFGKEVADSTKGREENPARIQELEWEIEDLKEEMREQSMAADPFGTGTPFEPDDIFCDPSPPHSSTQNGDADIEDLASSAGNTVGDLPSSHLARQSARSRYETLGPDAEQNSNVLRTLTHYPVATSATNALNQASVVPLTDNDTFRSARMSLERIFPGEIGLGLHTGDAKLLLDNMLDRLRSLKAQASSAEDALSTSRIQESNMRSQFNAVLAQLDRSRKAAEALSTDHSVEKLRAAQAESTAQILEKEIEQTSSVVNELRTDVDEKQRSIQKLQVALESYRLEVEKLEALITQMEANHSTAVAQLQTDMDEAVADLECHVVAEATGRRAAEKEAVERAVRIKELEALECEFKDAINEKQRTIRAMEHEVLEAKEIGEKEVGSLNVEVGRLSSSLEAVQADLAKIEREKLQLTLMLEEEKAASSKALEAVQAEMAQVVRKVDKAVHMQMVQCLDKVGDVKESHVKDAERRGAEVAEHKGLLTPVAAFRFRDGFKEIEGHVEVKRGKVTRKSRPDSGIVLEEDEDEEMLDG